MPNRSIKLEFTTGGLDRRMSYRQQRPYTARRLQNVRPDDSSQGAYRGGQRPGLKKAYTTELGSGVTINALGFVTIADEGNSGDGRFTWNDCFYDDAADLGGNWATPDWLTQQPYTREYPGWDDTNPSDVPDSGGGVISGLTISTAAGYVVKAYINEDTVAPATIESTYTVYARMANTSPDFTEEGIAAVVSINSATGAYSGVLLSVLDYVPTAYALASGTATINNLTAIGLSITSDSVTVSLGEFDEVTLLSAQAVDTHTGTSVGFDINPAQKRPSGSKTVEDAGFVTELRVGGTPASPRPNQLRQDIMVVGAGGSLYYEATPGNISTVSGATISSGHNIQMCQFLQKMYVADYNTSDTGVVHILDPTDGSWSTLTASVGTVPTNCDMIARWRGRIVLAKESIWYMSRVYDPTDWQYGKVDAKTAVAAQNSDAGVLGEPIRAMMPASDDLLLFGCDNSIWALHGDPAWGGSLHCLSEEVGVLDRFAYCFGPVGEIYFLSKDGLYVLPPGGNAKPKSLSREKLPRELLNIDTGMYEVSLGWSQKERAVYIQASPYEANKSISFVYSVEGGSFWIDSYDNDHDAFRIVNYKPIFGAYSAMLIGCRDGYLRKHDFDTTNDDGTSIDSYVDIGPIMMGGDGMNGVLLDMDTFLGVGSVSTAWSVYVGNSHENVFSQTTAFDSGTYDDDGMQYRERPRAGGASMIIRLRNTGDTTWSLEKILCTLARKGRQRRF